MRQSERNSFSFSSMAMLDSDWLSMASKRSRVKSLTSELVSPFHSNWLWNESLHEVSEKARYLRGTFVVPFQDVEEV